VRSSRESSRRRSDRSPSDLAKLDGEVVFITGVKLPVDAGALTE